MISIVAESVRLRNHGDDQAVMGATSVLDALSIAAIFCDARGRAVACSQTAERLLASGLALRLRDGLIEAADRACDRRLQAALRAATRFDPANDSASHESIGMGAEGPRLRVIPLRQNPSFLAHGVAAVLLIENAAHVSASLPLLKERFGFTRSEAEIASMLSLGLPIPEIASRRGTSKHTLRTQLKSIFVKASVRRQAELVAAMSRLNGRA